MMHRAIWMDTIWTPPCPTLPLANGSVAGPYEFVVTWSLRPSPDKDCFVDHLKVAPDAKSFTGSNQYGNSVSGIRR